MPDDDDPSKKDSAGDSDPGADDPGLDESGPAPTSILESIKTISYNPGFRLET
jgi:hypothetical protein